MTPALAIVWTARLAAFATAVAALELIAMHRALGPRGVFRWATLRRDYAAAPAPVRLLADALFGTRGTWVVLGVQLAAALALPWIAHPAVAWLAVASSLAISVRFRGTFNGGSDAMLLVVLIGLALARSAPGTPLELAGLAYIAVQLVLSYFVAGIAKLADARWRRGTALPLLVALPQYGVPRALRDLLSRPVVGRIAGTGMLAFECAFPAALVQPTACFALLAVGLGFHLTNAVAFGLNRFLWTWIAAYPSLVFWALR